MSKAKKGNEFVKMAVDVAVFGVGASMLGSASASMAGNKPAKAMVDAAGTLYSTKLLKHAGKGLI